MRRLLIDDAQTVDAQIRIGLTEGMNDLADIEFKSEVSRAGGHIAKYREALLIELVGKCDQFAVELNAAEVQ